MQCLIYVIANTCTLTKKCCFVLYFVYFLSFKSNTNSLYRVDAYLVLPAAAPRDCWTFR